MSKKLYRSRVDCKIGGVCAGLAEYFNIDPTIVRIIAILLIFADGIGIIGYIIAWIVMPRRPLEASGEVEAAQTAPAEGKKEDNSGWNIALPGIILIVIGLLFLIKNSYWWFDMGDLWPILLIIIGILMLIKRGGKKDETVGTQPNNSQSGEDIK